MADPLPPPIVNNLDINLVPNTPIYIRDAYGKEARDAGGMPVMDPAWVQFFIGLFNRVGGTSGDTIYNSTTIGTLIDQSGSAGASAQELVDLATIVWSLQAKGGSALQILDELKVFLNGLAGTLNTSLPPLQQLADLNAKVDNLGHDNSASQKVADLEAKVGSSGVADKWSQQIEDLRTKLNNLSTSKLLQYAVDYYTSQAAAQSIASKQALQRIEDLETVVFNLPAPRNPHSIVADIPSTTITKRFDFGDATPKLVFAAQPDKFIFSVKIIITTPFDGSGWSLTVGDSGDDDRLMQANQNNPGVERTYESTPSYQYADVTDINLYITPGTATEGTGYIVLIVEQ